MNTSPFEMTDEELEMSHAAIKTKDLLQLLTLCDKGLNSVPEKRDQIQRQGRAIEFELERRGVGVRMRRAPEKRS